jgi:hypothetical protein
MLKNKITNVFILFFLVSIIACGSGTEAEVDKMDDKDVIAPTIECVGAIEVEIPLLDNAAIVTYAAPVGVDNVSAITTQTSGLPSGASFPEGVTTNTFVAKDPSGNTASCSFDVTVTRVNDGSTPNFTGVNPSPIGKKWVRIAELSDEFEGASIDTDKWHTKGKVTASGWYW